MNNSYFKRVSSGTPTSFWINNVTREEAHAAIQAGATGCTQNPSYPWKMLKSDTDSTHAKKVLDDIMMKEPDDDKAIEILQYELVKEICQCFMPIYRATGGKQGWVSIQGNPFKEDVKSIIDFAHYHRTAAPNAIIKIPVTRDGLAAMRVLVPEGIPILGTEVMSIDQAISICELYKDVSRGMENPPVMYLAHIAGIFDEHLQVTVKNDTIDASTDALWHAGIAVAKKIRQLMDSRQYEVKFLSGGARGLHHFTEMVGVRGVVTINWKGTADTLIEQDNPVAQRFLAPVPYNVTDELLEKVEHFRQAYVPGSLKEEDYENFGSVVRFRESFASAWTSSRQYAKERRLQL
jgi:transaldolase